MIDYESLIFPLHILKLNVMDFGGCLMNFGRTKKILIVVVALIIAIASTGCDKTPAPGQSSPTLAPIEGQATVNPETGETPAPTATPDPLAAFRFWKIDPDKDIYNILLMGLDANEGTMWSRNDTTMILQINLEANTMKLVSFMRDMWIDLPGYSEKYRLNNAYYRGGPALAKQTMKSVFGVDIDYYAVVDFVAFELIMQRVVGPVKIRVMDYEVEHLKKLESAVSIDGEQMMGQGAVQNAGVQELNAYQLLSYGRDRHSSGDDNERAGDFGRNERQREIIKAAWTKVKSYQLIAIPGAAVAASVYVDTDMEPGLIITLLKQMMENDIQVEDMAMPLAGRYWALWIDRDRNIEYTTDDFKAFYESEKLKYEQDNAPAPDSTITDTGDGEVTVTVAPTPEKVEVFPSYETWKLRKGFPNVIEWSSKNLYTLHEFLGIN